MDKNARVEWNMGASARTGSNSTAGSAREECLTKVTEILGGLNEAELKAVLTAVNNAFEADLPAQS